MMKTNMHYLIIGILITVCFFLLTGFRLPSAPDAVGAYQFFKEKGSTGVWVFEPDSGTSKYFDLENGTVTINSFQMDSISVKTEVKTTQQKG